MKFFDLKVNQMSGPEVPPIPPKGGGGGGGSGSSPENKPKETHEKPKGK